MADPFLPEPLFTAVMSPLDLACDLLGYQRVSELYRMLPEDTAPMREVGLGVREIGQACAGVRAQVWIGTSELDRHWHGQPADDFVQRMTGQLVPSMLVSSGLLTQLGDALVAMATEIETMKKEIVQSLWATWALLGGTAAAAFALFKSKGLSTPAEKARLSAAVSRLRSTIVTILTHLRQVRARHLEMLRAQAATVRRLTAAGSGQPLSLSGVLERVAATLSALGTIGTPLVGNALTELDQAVKAIQSRQLVPARPQAARLDPHDGDWPARGWQPTPPTAGS